MRIGSSETAECTESSRAAAPYVRVPHELIDVWAAVPPDGRRDCACPLASYALGT